MDLTSAPEMIFGIPGQVFLIFVSAFFYIFAVVLFWRQYHRSGDELLSAFLAFLSGMAVFHLVLGIGSYYKNESLILLGLLAALTGSTFTLKFSLSYFSKQWRSWFFYSTLAVVWTIFLVAILSGVAIPKILTATLWYMIFSTGFLVSFYVVARGFMSRDRSTKIKCVGGGIWMAVCFLAADATVLFAGISILGEALMSLAPVIIILSVYYGRRVERLADAASLTKYVSI
ncbi:MAG: hypothetical protein AAB682_00925 [Patescibacteria group bacterium]